LRMAACGGGVRREETEDAATEFLGIEAVGSGVEGAGDDPELFGAAGGGVNHFRMAAGKRDILFITDEKNGKGASGNGFLRRDFRDGKAGKFFVAVEECPTERREKSLAEPGIFSQARIIVRGFAEIGERSFGNDGFDARIGGRGLQGDSSAHRFP